MIPNSFLCTALGISASHCGMMIISNCKNLQHKIVNECDHAFHFNLDLTLHTLLKNCKNCTIYDSLNLTLFLYHITKFWTGPNSKQLQMTLNKPFPKWQILDWFKLKEIAEDNLKFDGNGRMFSKWVENHV